MNRRRFCNTVFSVLGVASANACYASRSSGPPPVAANENSSGAFSKQDVDHLERAIELSQLTTTSGYGRNQPFAAVLVLSDGSVHEGWNDISISGNPLHHAELSLLLQALNKGVAKEQLATATLYASTEPCPMCAGAIYWSGVRRLVFGASTASFNELLTQLFPDRIRATLQTSSRNIFNLSEEKTEVIGPLLESAALKVHEEYWRQFQT